MILPGMGVVSEIIPTLRPQGHLRLQVHCLVLGRDRGDRLRGLGSPHVRRRRKRLRRAGVFIPQLRGAVPSAIKVFNWTATLHGGAIHFNSPMLYALRFILLFTIGGFTGLFLATLAFDVHATGTYFVVAHFHYIMVGGMVSAYFAALHYLVAEGHRAPLSGGLGPVRGGPDLLRLQRDFFSTVRAGLPRDAPALSRVSAGVSGLERPKLRRSVNSCHRLHPSSALSLLVPLPRRVGARQSLARDRTRMADIVAATDR